MNLIRSDPAPGFFDVMKSTRSISAVRIDEEELETTHSVEDEDVIGLLVHRRMELRRALGRLNNELLRLLYEEWTLTGRIPEGYEQLLHQTNENIHPIKTTSFPLPRTLIRRASTLTHPSCDLLNQSSASSQSSVPWTEDLTCHGSISNSPCQSSENVVQALTELIQTTEDEIPFVVPKGNCSRPQRSVGCSKSVKLPQSSAPTHSSEDFEDQTCAACSMQSSNENSYPSKRNPSEEPDLFVRSEYSWTEDEEDIKRTGYELQLRKLEIDYAIISQLYTVHKQRALETKRDAYRVAYKSNSRKLKEIREQIFQLKQKLQIEPCTPKDDQQREPKFSWQRRKTWNPLRNPAPQWSIATLPRRQSRYDSPDRAQVRSVDAYSTPVTPDRGFKMPFGSPNKPPPSLASNSASLTVSRASSAASERNSTPEARRRFSRASNQRSSIVPLIHFFRHSIKPNPEIGKNNIPAHFRARPSYFTRNKRSRICLQSNRKSSSEQQVVQLNTPRAVEEALPNRSNLFFSRRSWKYIPQNTCSFVHNPEPDFGSPVSSLRSSVDDPISVLRVHSTCSNQGTGSVEMVGDTGLVPTTASPNLHGKRKLRRSLSNPDISSAVTEIMRDSAIDLPDLPYAEYHTCFPPHSSRASHWHSVPDFTCVRPTCSLLCHRRGVHECTLLENRLRCIRQQIPNSTRDVGSRIRTRFQMPCLVSRSASSFPSSHRPVVTHNDRCPSIVNTDLNLRPAPSHASSASNWSTSGCSCLSSQTVSSSAATEQNPFQLQQKQSAPDQLQQNDGHSPPVIRLRNPEDRGRRFHYVTCNEGVDGCDSAASVKCMCSCFSERAETPLGQGDHRGSLNQSTDPTPVGSADCLDRPAFHFPRKHCISLVDSCETTVRASPVQAASSSPSCSALDLLRCNSTEKSRSQTTCGISGGFQKGLSKASSSRHSMRPFAFLRRAESRAKKVPTGSIDVSQGNNYETNKATGPSILPALVTGRQQIKSEKLQSKNAWSSMRTTSNGSRISQLACSSESGSPTVLIGDLTGKARFMWTGKFRHSSRGSSLKTK
ncbi:hypothetical protein FGIG_01329 [Fasciola gigantica]|uniref:Uncharacterized protein n=1 Tax=Fasciola gigantica TaxID=46835 RepID=A0A504Z3W8_FASGI|nr:hypothetical protein FGIG_01329 [Fasciola gigantica]